MKKRTNRNRNESNAIYIIPYGGCGEFGMNFTGYIIDKKQYVVDCGILFPDPARLGVDAIYPDINPFFSESKGVTAYLMTHGHEDHIGALPYIFERWPAPIYATAWTAELLKQKFQELGRNLHRHLHVVKAGDVLSLGPLQVGWMHVNHSIPMACALKLKAKGNVIVHTGDFKFERNPIGEPPASAKQIAKTVGEPVDLLLVDSTGSQAAGSTKGEASVKPALAKILNQSPGTVYIATFASNLWRLLVLLELASNSKRQVVIAGRGLNKTMDVAKTLGMFPKEYDKIIIADSDVKSKRKGKLLVITTGCQAEPMAVLARIARKEHKYLKLAQGDTIVFSSRIIPGNEKGVFGLVSQCKKLGANVITTKENPEIHVSGHANSEDIDGLIRALKPAYLLPVHGDFSHLNGSESIGRKYGNRLKGVRAMENGVMLRYENKELHHVNHFEIDRLYVDSMSKLSLEGNELKQRLRIGELGCALLVGTYAYRRGRWMQRPELEYIGIGNEGTKKLQSLAKTLETKIEGIVSHHSDKKIDSEKANEEIRISIRQSIANVLRKKVVVISKITFIA